MVCAIIVSIFIFPWAPQLQMGKTHCCGYSVLVHIWLLPPCCCWVSTVKTGKQRFVPSILTIYIHVHGKTYPGHPIPHSHTSMPPAIQCHTHTDSHPSSQGGTSSCMGGLCECEHAYSHISGEPVKTPIWTHNMRSIVPMAVRRHSRHIAVRSRYMTRHRAGPPIPAGQGRGTHAPLEDMPICTVREPTGGSRAGHKNR